MQGTTYIHLKHLHWPLCSICLLPLYNLHKYKIYTDRVLLKLWYERVACEYIWKRQILKLSLSVLAFICLPFRLLFGIWVPWTHPILLWLTVQHNVSDLLICNISILTIDDRLVGTDWYRILNCIWNLIWNFRCHALRCTDHEIALTQINLMHILR